MEVVRAFFGAGSSEVVVGVVDDVDAPGRIPSPQSASRSSRSASGCSCLIAIEGAADKESVAACGLFCWSSVSSAPLLALLPSGLVLDGQREVVAFSDSAGEKKRGG